MPNFKRIGGGPWKNGQKSVDLTWNDPVVGHVIYLAAFMSLGKLFTIAYTCGTNVFTEYIDDLSV